MAFLAEKDYVTEKEGYGELLDFDGEKITDCLEAWVEHLGESGLAQASVASLLSGAELFFVMNRKAWHKKLVRRGIGKDKREASGHMVSQSISFEKKQKSPSKVGGSEPAL